MERWGEVHIGEILKSQLKLTDFVDISDILFND